MFILKIDRVNLWTISLAISKLNELVETKNKKHFENVQLSMSKIWNQNIQLFSIFFVKENVKGNLKYHDFIFGISPPKTRYIRIKMRFSYPRAPEA